MNQSILLLGLVGTRIMDLPQLIALFGDKYIIINIVALVLLFLAWFIVILGVVIRGL